MTGVIDVAGRERVGGGFGCEGARADCGPFINIDYFRISASSQHLSLATARYHAPTNVHIIPRAGIAASLLLDHFNVIDVDAQGDLNPAQNT